MMEGTVCVLCQGTKEGPLVCVERGIDTIRRCSEVRNDGVATLIKHFKCVFVHVNCRKEYTRRIALMPSNVHVLPVKRKVRSSLVQFNFKRQCMFCEQDIGSNEKLKHPERQAPYSLVKTLNFVASIKSMALKRSDIWAEKVMFRVNTEIDLVASKARYHRACYTCFSQPKKFPPTVTHSSGNAGRPEDSVKKEAFEGLCDYLESNDECQYSFRELIEFMASYAPHEPPYSEKHLKRKLQNHFGDEIVIAEQFGKPNVLCFTGTAHQILTSNWYTDKKSNNEEENMRIVETAAKIIRRDIRSRVYDCSVYPTKENIVSGSEDMLPDTLKIMVQTIIQTRKPFNDDTALKRKATNIAHTIIAAARPRSFISPLLLGLGVHVHRRYGSKFLLDILSKLGVCATYKEIVNFENSIANNVPPSIDDDAYVQYVFDNADYNIKTLDGHGTFHAMGGIKCITPAKCVNSSVPVPRSTIPKATIALPSLGFQPVTTYQRPLKPGTSLVVLEDVSTALAEPKCVVHACLSDTLWLTNYLLSDKPYPGWNGYMDAINTAQRPNSTAEKSSILPLPFVNLSPSNPSTIYTCILTAAEQCQMRNQSSCVITFDQPLYAKALDIVLSAGANSPLSSVVVRLGGFHLLMSFMGAVGSIMAGSGLEELWEEIYAKNTVVHMMSGHAYARAIRAHLLTQVALANFLLHKVKDDSNLVEELKAAYNQVVQGEESIVNICASASLIDASSRINSTFEEVAASGRTGKLWTEYYKMVTIMRLFIRAERSGDWKMHLYCVQRMLPYLHAGGHLNYAKSAHIYLQQMLKVEDKMNKLEFDQFVNHGFFTIRRSDKFWCGIWTDMAIEQVLMRTMKTEGGLTHGRGMSENVIARWVSTMPASCNIIDAIESFSGVSFESSDQHVELRESRQIRDKGDVERLVVWFVSHNPFEGNPMLVSLSTRVVADDSVNCDEAYSRGLELVKSIVGQRLSDVHLKRKDKVTSLGSIAKSVKIKNTKVEINPNQLFHRLLCVVRSEEELAQYLTYELAARPPALFDGTLLRKGKKSTLVSVLQQLSPCEDELPPEPMYTIDGGFLLHRVVWMRPASFSQICDQYIKYIETHFSISSTVVFDGYGSPTTKDNEHTRRSCRAAADADIEDSTPTTVPQAVFLSNESNKKRFINLLSRHLKSVGIRVLQAEDDADTLIVSTAAETSKQNNAVIVGEDTDLLVLMATLPVEANIWMFMPGKKRQDQKVFSGSRLMYGLGELQPYLLFFHAATGCDTTSTPFRKGKARSFKKLQDNPELMEKISVFNKPDSTHLEIAEAGELFLLHLYGCDTKSTLDIERHKAYLRTVAKQSLTSQFDLATLPPTTSAAQQHSYRVYHQVQAWKGVRLPATEWGWNLQNGRYVPVHCEKEPAPTNILSIISCNCKSGCERNCQCLRYGLNCTMMCGYCAGHGCANRATCNGDDITDIN